MLDKIISLKITNYLNLIRFFNPIGYLLLMWPCFFSLALLPINQISLINWYMTFFFGSFLMRSAGCIINDLIDINIDNKIARTKDRPLTSKKISILEAIIFLFLLLIFSLIILLQFNSNAILAGIFCLPLIIIYPFMKRFTYWPQLLLGILFSWSTIIISFQFINYFSLDYIYLFIGCIFWTLAYDTIYAFQDREDDIKNDIKSSAIYLGNKGKIYVKFFYMIFFLIIGYLGFKSSESFYSLIVIIILIFVINSLLKKWDPTSRNSSNYYFKINNLIGLGCFLFLLIF